MVMDEGLFALADAIAIKHTPPKGFLKRYDLVTRIRLRTDIYNALVRQKYGSRIQITVDTQSQLA